jgi:hypothetical protein
MNLLEGLYGRIEVKHFIACCGFKKGSNLGNRES